MTLTIKGQRTIVKQRPRRVWKRGLGWVVRERWKGSPTEVEKKVRELTSDGAADEVLVDDRTGVCTVEADYSDEFSENAPPNNQNITEIRWELDTSDEQVSVWHHPRFVTIGDDRKNLIINAHQANTLDSLTSLSSLETILVTLLKKRQEHYAHQSYVLRKITTTGWRSKVRAAYGDVGNVTTNPFSGQPVNPNSMASGGVKFDLPAGEWLKRAPRVTFVAGRFTIAEEWWWASTWNGFIYPGGTGLPDGS